MSESSYKIIQLVGTSDESWEKAARNAIETASKSIGILESQRSQN
jgi:flavin-binding protein dodecin